jgi:hypothetical protein
MGALTQALDIIFEVQRTRSNEKKTFQLTKHIVILFGPLLLSNLIIFLFLIHLKQFKVL